MDVHRLEAVVDADAVRPARERCPFIPAEDRRSVSTKGLEVAAVLRVVRMVIEPVEGVAGHLERQVVAGHLADRAGGVDHEGKAIRVLLVAEPRVEPALRVEHPVEAAELLVPHHRIEERDPVPRIARELVAVRRGIAGERRRRPGHPRLVDQERVVVGPRRPVPREGLVESTSLRGPPPAGTSRASAPAAAGRRSLTAATPDPGRGPVAGAGPAPGPKETHRR